MTATGPVSDHTTDPPAASPVPDRGRRRVRLLLVVGVGLALVVALVVRARLDRDPVEVVEEFFAAIVDRDVDRALGHVGRIGSGVPYGEPAAFLHPDAIAGGWELLEAEQVDRAGHSRTWVQVTIGDEQTHASGLLELTDFGGEWNLVDPFVTVQFVSAPLSYLHVNDRVLDGTDLYAHDLTGTLAGEYRLLPGRYEFFPDLPRTTVELDEPKLLLPPEHSYSTPELVRVPRLSFRGSTRAAVQREVNALLDECADFQVRQPAGCPFAVDSYLSIPSQDSRVYELRDIRWTVVEYPVVELTDPGGEERELGLPVLLGDPGLVRLSVTGAQERRVDGEYTERVVDVTVDCEVGETLRVVFGPDGSPRVHQPQVVPGGLGALFQIPVRPTCPDLRGDEL